MRGRGEGRRGQVTNILCTYDPATRGGECERKIKGTLHWLNAEDAVPAEFRLYDYLLLPDDDPETAGLDYTERQNPNSLVKVQGFVEPAAAEAAVGSTYQFMRVGYFCKDPDSTAEHPVYNRTVGLKDSK